MEDLWRIQNSAIEIDEFTELAEYKKILARFCVEEEQGNIRSRLFETTKK